MGAATFAAKFQLPADSAVSSYYLFPPRPSACRLPLSRLKSAVLRQHWQCAPPQASELFSRFTRAVLHEASPHETCLNSRLEDVKKQIYIFLSCMNQQFPSPPMHERNLCAQDMSSITVGCVRELGKPRRTVRADPARSQAPIGRGTLERTRAAQDPRSGSIKAALLTMESPPGPAGQPGLSANLGVGRSAVPVEARSDGQPGRIFTHCRAFGRRPHMPRSARDCRRSAGGGVSRITRRRTSCRQSCRQSVIRQQIRDTSLPADVQQV